jgi:hypothetical protein
MMIPPLPRTGPPPSSDQLRYPQEKFVILVEGRGWIIARWYDRECLIDTSPPEAWRVTILPSRVLCWMPQDGS